MNWLTMLSNENRGLADTLQNKQSLLFEKIFY